VTLLQRGNNEETMDVGSLFQTAIALLFVLGLIAGLALLARRAGLGGAMAKPSAGKKRLTVSEVMSLDAKRRLILVRRDDVEHLLLLGLNSETVVETAITPPTDAKGQTS